MIVRVGHDRESLKNITELWAQGLSFSPISNTSGHGERERIEKVMSGAFVRELPRGSVVVFTAGTTGKPKGIILSRENLLASAQAFGVAHKITKKDRWLLSLPLHHVSGLSIVIRAAELGFAVVFPAGRGVEEIIKAVIEHEVTGVSLVPAQLKKLLDTNNATLKAFQNCRILVGGAPLSAQLRDEAIARGLLVNESYGASETAAQVVNNGLPHIGVDIHCNNAGEVFVRGPMVAKCFITEEGIFENVDGDGYWHSGDVGTIDAGGALHLLGRLKDIIISGGVKISPLEVEGELLSQRGVRDAAAFSLADERWGEVVCAAVVIDADTSLERLKEEMIHRLGPQKAPKKIFHLSEIPRNENGKISRAQLAEKFVLRLQSIGE